MRATFQCQRKSPRTSAFSAGLLVGDDRSEPLNCLIRDISRDGAQIRVNAAQPVPERGYMINLMNRCVYQTRAVWRRGSLAGIGLDQKVAIDNLLPANLEFLGRLFLEAKMRQVDQLISEGMERTAAFRKCGVAEKLNRRRSDIISV
jgi:hypothetical protein